jgi:hypothetical protein
VEKEEIWFCQPSQEKYQKMADENKQSTSGVQVVHEGHKLRNSKIVKEELGHF